MPVAHPYRTWSVPLRSVQCAIHSTGTTCPLCPFRDRVEPSLGEHSVTNRSRTRYGSSYNHIPSHRSRAEGGAVLRFLCRQLDLVSRSERARALVTRILVCCTNARLMPRCLATRPR